MIIFNQKIHFNSVIFLTKHITCIFKINARVLTDVNSERPRAADVHLSLHSDLIPLLQWLQASPPRPWWSSSSSPSWASSSWSYPGLCFGFSAAGETRTKSSAKGEWIIFVAQIKSVKHSMTHQFHSLNWYAFECISIVLFSQYNIFMYWETLPGKTKPTYLDLCYETILKNCSQDFKIHMLLFHFKNYSLITTQKKTPFIN